MEHKEEEEEKIKIRNSGFLVAASWAICKKKSKNLFIHRTHM